MLFFFEVIRNDYLVIAAGCGDGSDRGDNEYNDDCDDNDSDIITCVMPCSG